MKKLLITAILLLFGVAFWAQAQSNLNSVIKGPVRLPFELGMMPIQGVSGNGKYLWGHRQGNTYVYNTQDGTYKTWITPDEDHGYEIGHVNNDGDVLMCEKEKQNFFQFFKFNIDKPNQRVEIIVRQDNIENFAMDAGSVDGRYVVGRIYSPDWASSKLLAIDLQNVNNPKITELEEPKLDFSGQEVQHCRIWAISNDGSTVIGTIVGYRGVEGELAVWKRNTNGSYSLTKPLNDYLFDLSQPLPGPRPEADDYITADPEKNPDEYDKQVAEFDKADAAWHSKYYALTKNQALYLFKVSLSTNERYLLAQITRTLSENSETDEFETGVYPLIVDLKDFSCKEITEANGYLPAWMLANGDILAIKEHGTNFFDTYVITSPQRGMPQVIPMLQWLKQETGNDFTEHFTETTPALSDSSMGYPVLSHDGKTIAFCGRSLIEGEIFRKNYIILQNVLDTAQPIDTSNNKAYFDGKTLHTGIPGSTVLLYTPLGEYLGKFATDSQGNLGLTTLTPGNYIAHINLGNKITALKLTI